MRLRRLELFGFKSFADRVVLDFEQALTAIVGPNGCGKSNVVDAIRWVLGEQRPTSMRGGEMVDVIFKGSSSRAPMSVAEVTMVLDNRLGALDDRGEEVAITRRVYRGGEGEYLIDGSRVRLKDVRDMLYGTGLGSRGYSVLEQGKIDAVLSANPVDRRAIFEEAAGISRYRQRKKETESRLKRVEADLVRLDDVLGELGKRQRSLRIQAGRARRFLEARDAWRVDGLRLARHQVHGLKTRIAVETRDLAAAEERAEQDRRRRGAAVEDVQTREREQEALASEVDRLSAEAAHAGGELRAVDERRDQLRARVVAWEEAAEEEGARAEVLDARLEARRGERRELDESLAEIDRAATRALGREQELASRLREARAELRQAREASEGANELVLGLLHERTSGRNRVQHLEESLEPLAERSRRANHRREEAAASATAAGEAEAEAREDLARLERDFEEVEADRRALAAEVETVGGRREELDARRAELELESARLASRVEALTDWEREREKLESGARQVLEAVAEGEGPALAGAIAGLFADHLKTDTRNARALDAVLDLRAQALVVESTEDARSIVGWLKAEERGRVHLVLPEGLAASEPAEVPDELAAAPGVLGRLLDVVACEASFTDLARRLFGDVVLVEEPERGLELVREHPSLRFATPDGDLVEAGGLVGGHTETVQGAVGRRSFAAELEGRRARTADEHEEILGQLGELREREAQLQARLGGIVERLEGLTEERALARGALETARNRRVDLEEAVAISRHESEGLVEECARTEEDLAAARRSLAAVEERFERENALLSGAESRRAELEGRVERLARDEAHARVDAAGVRERLEAARRRSEELDRSLEEYRVELERTRQVRVENVESAVRGREEAERLGVERESLLERRGELEERLEEMRRRERAGREAIETLRRHSEAITGELETLLSEVAEKRLEKQRLELSRDEIRRRAEEDFTIAAHALLEGFEPADELSEEASLEALAESVSELKAKMEKLGPVNLEAVDELEEVTERLDFLQTQRRDVSDARRSLVGTIDKLNTESRRLFTEAFEEIRTQFRLTFRQLFGGGRADISLVDSEDVLEAGIEITARPPGRESLPISLLSGGQRTLTALALLFGVFQTRPSPFCVLDEVDAALDDANINRFLALLRESLSDTQFVVVTHNKGTMAAGDLLYGVTMAVRGVSRVVSVELSEVEEFVPEATGTMPGEVRVPEEEEEEAPTNGRDAEAEEERVVELVPHRPDPAPVAPTPAVPQGEPTN